MKQTKETLGSFLNPWPAHVQVFQQQNSTTELGKTQRAATGTSRGPAGLLRRRLLEHNPCLGAEVMDEDFLQLRQE